MRKRRNVNCGKKENQVSHKKIALGWICLNFTKSHRHSEVILSIITKDYCDFVNFTLNLDIHLI